MKDYLFVGLIVVAFVAIGIFLIALKSDDDE